VLHSHIAICDSQHRVKGSNCRTKTPPPATHAMTRRGRREPKTAINIAGGTFCSAEP
jgi:hypothetical protein